MSPRSRPGILSPKGSHKTSNTVSQLQESVHIDSLKKKLIGDQIRQRMQNNASSSSSSKKRGRGRPPKISKDLSPKETEVRITFPSKHTISLLRHCDIMASRQLWSDVVMMLGVSWIHISLR